MDIVNLVNFILDLNSPTNYQFWASDINEDGQLNILDVVLIANQILGLNKFNSNKKTFFNYEIKNNYLQLSGYFIAGFEITSNNDLEIINIIAPDEWEIISNHNKVVGYTMGNTLEGEITIQFSDEIDIREIIVSDGFGKSVEVSNNLQPQNYVIMDSYPNPFNPTTTINIELFENSYSQVKIYNITGQLMDVLHEGMLFTGDNSFTWDAGNLASGIYFMAVEVNNSVTTHRLMLMK